MIEKLQSAFSYDPGTGIITRNSTGKPAFSAVHVKGYRCGWFKGKNLLAHRVAFAMHHGKWPDQIDHLNGDRTDNRICNLRSVSSGQNAKNQAMRQSNTSGYTGVSMHKPSGLWQAYINERGKRHSLGYFRCATAAGLARAAEAKARGFSERHGLPLQKRTS